MDPVFCRWNSSISRGLTRRSHRPPAIERHLLEQDAMFIATDVRFEAHYGLKPDSEPCPKSANSRSRRSATCAGRGGRSIGLGPGVKRILSTGAHRSPAIPLLHLPSSIDKKMIEILDANQTEPRILHVRNNVECNC
jgi:hypothetical protein